MFEALTYCRPLFTKEMPVVMLTAHTLNPDALKKSIELGARAYTPKDQIVKMITAFLEDLLNV